MGGDIVVQKSDIDDISIVSDASSTSSGSRRQPYRSRTREEKQKKRHSPKGKRIKWWDDKVSEIKREGSSFPIHPPVRPSSAQADPVTTLNSRIRGVPIEVETKLQALVSQSNNMP